MVQYDSWQTVERIILCVLDFNAFIVELSLFNHNIVKTTGLYYMLIWLGLFPYQYQIYVVVESHY